MSKSYLERITDNLIIEAGLPEPIREYRFHETRRWRCDYLWIKDEKKIMLEVEGGIFMKNGKHSSAVGMTHDMEKYNEAALLGYMVLRVTKFHLISGQAMKWVAKALGIEDGDKQVL